MSTTLAGYQYDQAGQRLDTRPPFDLADEILGPDGQVVTASHITSEGEQTLRLSASRARVYSLLRQTADRRHRHPIGAALGPPGWVPSFLLRETWSGGGAGQRRTRDLRRFGCRIEWRRWAELGGPEDSDTTLYRLVEDPIAEGATSSSPSTVEEKQEAPPQDTAGTSDTGELSHVTIYIASKQPDDRLLAGSMKVTPGLGGGLNAIAPGKRVREMMEGGSSREELDAAYRQELLERYRSGRLVASISGEKRVVLWHERHLRWSPLPMLTKALRALGAQWGGEWRE